ncbi:PEP-CTERM sorting domain-containing protein [Massilia sp. HP4]|uniref:PEP-CTERM sorting domain-containing protein n=1 Tax=Massilia sp. HP4 TaxID=2562316 RepID=UPI0010BFF4A7|nr:PEP-CTERM sorting domain-containing protein [Massilia sp. HP4]
MLRFTPLLFAAALLAQPAEAAVTYTWQQIDASSAMPANLNLRLVFSDNAVRQGKLTLDIMNDCNYGGSCDFEQDSLLSLHYWYGAKDAPQKGVNLIDFGYRSKPKMFHDHIALDLTFLPDGMLSGWISANNGESDFAMESVGSLFTVSVARSDQPDGCGMEFPECAGSTGLLVEVPEPSSAALAGLGVLAGWFARRRKGQARA